MCRNLPWHFHSDRANQVIFKLCSQQLHPLQPIENKAPAHLPSWRFQWVSTAGLSMCSSCISTWRILILWVHPVPADDTVGRKPEQSELQSSWMEHRSPPTKGTSTGTLSMKTHCFEWESCAWDGFPASCRETYVCAGETHSYECMRRRFDACLYVMFCQQSGVKCVNIWAPELPSCSLAWFHLSFAPWLEVSRETASASIQMQ